jgi:hypothetical protein
LFSNSNTTQNDSIVVTQKFKNLEKVILKLKNIGQTVMYMYSNYFIEDELNMLNIFDKKYSNVKFDTNSIQKLNTIHYKCDERRNDKMSFTDEYTANCAYDCIINEFITICGCLPVHQFKRFLVGLEKDLKAFGYKVCENPELKTEKIVKRCESECVDYCSQINMFFESEDYSFTNSSEYTV